MINLSKEENDRVANIVSSLSEMSFPAVEQIVSAGEARMQMLREIGVSELAEQFEAMAEQTFGMTAKQIMAASRKRRREQEQETEEQATNDA